MNKGSRLSILLFILAAFPGISAGAQDVDSIVTPSIQREILSYIACDAARGRATGTPFCRFIADFIHDQFVRYDLKPYLDGQYYSQFRLEDGHMGRNVIGIVPARRKTDRYIIVSAHYDHMGSINGYTFNGADDNGSGVTVMLGLAKMFSAMRNVGYKPKYNILFVALDAKEADMAGSKDFVKRLRIPKEKIFCSINLDQVGTSLEPVHDNGKPYIIILGKENLPEERRNIIDQVNTLFGLGFDIDYTFYDSKKFASYVFKTSDQTVFKNAGIPALLVTSGFTDHTYKTTDDVDLIDFDMMYRRTILLYHIICHL